MPLSGLTYMYTLSTELNASLCRDKIKLKWVLILLHSYKVKEMLQGFK